MLNNVTFFRVEDMTHAIFPTNISFWNVEQIGNNYAGNVVVKCFLWSSPTVSFPRQNPCCNQFIWYETKLSLSLCQKNGTISHTYTKHWNERIFVGDAYRFLLAYTLYHTLYARRFLHAYIEKSKRARITKWKHLSLLSESLSVHPFLYIRTWKNLE